MEKQLGHNDCAGVLQKTLDEEKAVDRKSHTLAEGRINLRAARRSVVDANVKQEAVLKYSRTVSPMSGVEDRLADVHEHFDGLRSVRLEPEAFVAHWCLEIEVSHAKYIP